jgi:uncharacterized protein (DUF2062 family)
VPHDRPTTGQAIRRFTLGSGPLKRNSDRLELLARIVLTSVLLSAVAITLAVAIASYTQGRSEVVAQASERQQVSAELLEDASVPKDGSESVPDVARATAVWTAPSGVERTAAISVPVRAKAGSTQAIWIDRNGDRTTHPLSSGDVVGGAVCTALLTYLGISMVAIGAYRLFRRQLDRSRFRRWADEWAVVEPKWTGKAS